MAREQMVGAPDTGARWAVFARKWAETVRASFGSIGASTGDYTALEYATGAWPGETIPKAREVLRGYSWVMVLAGELAPRLGGQRRWPRPGPFLRWTRCGMERYGCRLPGSPATTREKR
jgi:hypothetical protein